MLKKIVNVLSSGRAYQRIILFINKTELLRGVFKSLQNVLHLPTYLRRNMNFSLQVSSELSPYLEKLNREGYVDVTALMEPQLMHELEKYGSARLESKNQITTDSQSYGKKIWLRLSDLDKDLSTEHALIKVSIQEKLLQLLGAYFGKPAFLDYVLMTLSQNESGNDQLTQSQLWHYDRDDYRVVKLFVYLTDVDQVEKGPFTLFSKPSSQKFDFGSVNRYWTDHEIYSHIPSSELIQMKAPKLSAFLVCTDQCLHMGSRIKPGFHRLMTTSTYITIPASHPWSGSRSYPIKNEISEIQRLALEKV